MKVQLQMSSLQLCTPCYFMTRAPLSILKRCPLKESAGVQIRLTQHSQMHSWCPLSRAVAKILPDDLAGMHSRPATHSQMHNCCPVPVALTNTSWKFPSNESAAVHSIISTASLLATQPGSCLMSYSCSSISQGVDLSFRGSCSSLEDHPAILLASCRQAGRGLRCTMLSKRAPTDASCWVHSLPISGIVGATAVCVSALVLHRGAAAALRTTVAAA